MCVGVNLSVNIINIDIDIAANMSAVVLRVVLINFKLSSRVCGWRHHQRVSNTRQNNSVQEVKCLTSCLFVELFRSALIVDHHCRKDNRHRPQQDTYFYGCLFESATKLNCDTQNVSIRANISKMILTVRVIRPVRQLFSNVGLEFSVYIERNFSTIEKKNKIHFLSII